MYSRSISFFFFFNDTATTEIYTLSLHDALPIYLWLIGLFGMAVAAALFAGSNQGTDRKSTRLNSSHTVISYAVFCLKKKKNCQHRRRANDAKRESERP